MAFDIKKLFRDVFEPQSGEVVTFMTDEPHGEFEDHRKWVERRKMCEEWYDAVLELKNELGLKVNPIYTYAATGKGGAELPEYGVMNDKEIHLEEMLKQSDIVVSFSEYSATGPLFSRARNLNFRVASLPCVEKRMEDAALSANYAELRTFAEKLAGALQPAIGGGVLFSTGHRCYFDLRYRNAVKDIGYMPKSNDYVPFGNLPAGEVFKAPYEGENEGEPSRTCGELPHDIKGEIVIYKVQENRIVEVVGSGTNAEERRRYYSANDGRNNIAEFGLGCNFNAQVTGNPLEDEKAGFHWAYGLCSGGWGGKTGPEKFKAPSDVIHKDIIYAPGCPITIKTIELCYEDGTKLKIWEKDRYLI